MSGPTPPTVESALVHAITLLSGRLTAADIAANWTEDARKTFLTWMQDLLARSRRGDMVRDQSMSIIRNLDVNAIQGGRLHDAVLAVQRAWRP
jgi:hypothetical protein